MFNHFKGLVYIQKWAPNRHAANVAFIAARAAALKPALPKAGAYFQFAQEGFSMLERSHFIQHEYLRVKMKTIKRNK